VTRLALPPVPPESREAMQKFGNPGTVMSVEPSHGGDGGQLEVRSDFEDEPGAATQAFTGQTMQEWKGGGVYQGQVVQGKRQGEGIMTWPTGKIYVGHWKDDKFHGHGLLQATAERGCIYNGEFAQGKCHGVGRCEWPTRGTWYDGEWVAGFQDGMGEVGALVRKARPAGGVQLPHVTAHICRMENGQRQENLAASMVSVGARVQVVDDGPPLRHIGGHEDGLAVGQRCDIGRPPDARAVVGHCLRACRRVARRSLRRAPPHTGSRWRRLGALVRNELLERRPGRPL